MNSSSIQHINNILILDDDVLQAKALSKKLIKGGYQVSAVTHTGVQTIAAVKKNPPDIALLDINLNGQQIDGIEVGTALQELHPDIIIIYITAYANDENFKKALDSKPYAFIEKPYQMKTLHREIEMAVQKVIQLKESLLPTNQQVPIPSSSSRLVCLPNCFLLKDGAGGGHQKINLTHIYYLKADGMYTSIFTDQKKIYATLMLKAFVEHLNFPSLLRVHNSYMVNLTQIKEVQVKHNGGKLLLENGAVVPVSKSYVEQFWEGIGRLNSKQIS